METIPPKTAEMPSLRSVDSHKWLVMASRGGAAADALAHVIDRNADDVGDEHIDDIGDLFLVEREIRNELFQ